MTTQVDRHPHHAPTRHDCRWSDPVLQVLTGLNLWTIPREEQGVIVDPFAGVGSSGTLWSLDQALGTGEGELVGIELEPEWAQAQPWIRQGNALTRSDYPDNTVAVVTSPIYGNRMSGDYLGPACEACSGNGEVTEGEPCQDCGGSGHNRTGRFGYAIALNRKLSAGSAAKLGWGDSYKKFHRDWLDLLAGLLPYGESRLVINMSDHYRAKKRQYVVNWWIGAAKARGFELAHAEPATTQRFGMGQNGQDRVAAEMVLVFDHVAP